MVEAQLEQLGELGDAEIPVDVWIDADGLPRRMQLDMGGDVRASGRRRRTLTMTIELFDYGEPVDIEVPSPDEVHALHRRARGLRRRASGQAS